MGGGALASRLGRQSALALAPCDHSPAPKAHPLRKAHPLARCCPPGPRRSPSPHGGRGDVETRAMAAVETIALAPWLP
eukprot:scaffold105577_cov45-Phaeocystis_antarctica.AAC.1